MARVWKPPANSLQGWLSPWENLQGAHTWHCLVLGLGLGRGGDWVTSQRLGGVVLIVDVWN